MDREQIINAYNKLDFEQFLSNDSNGLVLELFNEEGINILKNSDLKEERIEYILAFSPYKNKLLHNLSFLDLTLNTDIRNYYALLNNLDDETCDIILNRSIELNISLNDIGILFYYFKTSYQLKKLDNWQYSMDLIYFILSVSDVEVTQKILNNYNIDLTNDNIYLPAFFSKRKASVLKSSEMRNKNNINIPEISIPPRLITTELAKKIWKNYDIFEIREMIDDANYCTDVTLLNNYIKSNENQIISNYKESDILSPFNEIFNLFKTFKIEKLKQENNEENNYYDSFRKYIYIINKVDNKLHDEFEEKYNNGGIDSVKEYLKKLCDNMISNYVIDYHFEENYYNIILDLRELLNFYYDGNISIPNNRLELYYKISNIDYLSIDEKIELHNILKTINIKELFYDDMRLARDIVNEAIKEASLTTETLKQYKNKKLSKEYGVDVYTIENNSFFGVVKTGKHLKDNLPTGHSYSLIGDKGLAVFGDVKKSNTFLYDAGNLNVEQIVHIYPYDSFTMYHPFEFSEKSTNRVNVLMMPNELVETSKSYNEMIILEKGTIETGIDKRIPQLKRIALYCIDEIRKQDIEVAKQERVGILLINSNNYTHTLENTSTKYRHNITNFDYNYYNSYDKEKFEKTR